MAKQPIPDKLLEILACPACEDRPRVELVGHGLRCPRCGRTYRIEKGVPVMLVEQAEGGQSE